MSNAEMMAELSRLREENAKLLAKPAARISMKVSPKGALSVYGMGKWPVTLYRQQWTKLLDMQDDIRAFITANELTLTVKQ